MYEWIQFAAKPEVVRRGVLYAVVVGSLLVAINHSDALTRGEVSSGRVWRICLTVMVPYLVSTLSSVAAMREARTRTATTVCSTDSGEVKRSKDGSSR